MAINVLEDVNVDVAFATVRAQLLRLVTSHAGAIPTHTRGGRWHIDDDAWAPGWTGGFLAGMLWAVASRTGELWWRDQAEQYSLRLEGRKFDSGTHDLGFIFTPSWGRWYAVDPVPRTREVLIQAGRTLASGFNYNGRFLRTWVGEGSTFIDVMMNLDIIYQAAELSHDPDLAQIATQHALTSRRFLVRGDSSTVHEGWFNVDSGEFLRPATHQGYRSDSCWARGHAWAIYGFTIAFARTGDNRFLDTAIACADLYISRTGDALVPPNDWDDPDPEFPFEASAGAVAASAMLQLGEVLGAAAAEYVAYGSRILARLASPEFMAQPGDGWEGVIKHALYHRANGLGVDESNMWGDYFFTEALERYHRLRGGAS